MRESSSVSSLPYKVWYCPDLPLTHARVGSIGGELVHRTRPRLLEDMRTRGMINPIIVLNHRDPTQWEPYWVWVGANRVWAAKQLGWTSVPAIVTGSCDFFCQLVEPQDLPSYFRDGCPVVDKNGWLGMTGYSNFTKGQLPA